MKKKIGIITYHFCGNYGAILQCYALLNYLKSLGAEVSTLNAISIQQEYNNSLYSGKSGMKKLYRNIALFPLHNERLNKEKKFKQFINNEFNCTKLVRNNVELKQLIDDEQFDIILTGSDQVWNPKNNDFTDMFMFPFETHAKKYGYAVSIGLATEFDLLSYKNEISDFIRIGIREKTATSTIALFNKSTIENVDPVLLFDKTEWESLAKRSNIKIKKPYLLCYFINKNNFKKYYNIAQKISKELGLVIVIVNAAFGTYSFYKNTYVDVGPDDFVNLLCNANFVCTDSFHGTVFSTILETQFMSFISSSTISDSRVSDFLDLVELTDRIIYGDQIYLTDTHIKINIINFNHVYPKITGLISSSKKYLSDLVVQ